MAVPAIPVRKIIHIDMDAFYASVEQMDHPELIGLPIAVGGSKERGVVAAASYEARKFGVRSAMSSKLAAIKCPDLIFMPPRFDRYKEISNQIREIFYRYTDLVEPLSLDEAFLDVTENKTGHPSATILAMEIRTAIKNELGLNASAGISINKFTAKIASDINKPNGQKTIPPEEVQGFLERLPIRKFFGVGKVTAEKMNLHGIHYGIDLKRFSANYLEEHFGKSGIHFYNIVRGIQHSKVEPDRVRKSVAAERTFEKDISKHSFMMEQLHKIADALEKRMINAKVKGKTITLKLKYSDFTVQTRSRTVDSFVQSKEDFFPTAVELLSQEPVRDAVRLLGISITKLDSEHKPVDLDVQLEIAF